MFNFVVEYWYFRMFQDDLQTKGQKLLVVACIYMWIAVNRTLLFSIFQLSLPKRIKLMLRG